MSVPYDFSKKVNLENLHANLQLSSISQRYLYADYLPEEEKVIVHCNEELEEWELIKLQEIITAHVPQGVDEYIKETYEKARTFGRELQDEFTRGNIKSGITQANMTNHVRKATRELRDCMNTGSLYDALDELSLMDPSKLDGTFLSASRLLVFRNKIEDYLGVPRATTWNQQRTW